MEIESVLKTEKKVLLYGAQIYAMTVYHAIKNRYPQCRVVCFLVTEKENNPEEIDGIPVLDAANAALMNCKIPVLIATPEFYHQEIWQNLSLLQYSRVLPVTTAVYELLVSADCLANDPQFQMVNAFAETTTTTRKCADSNPLAVYMAKSAFDKPLATAAELPDWIYPIQVGAALSVEAVCALRDNQGEQISDKNRNYCELTAAYWIWKQGLTADYVGLCHYRRYLDLSDSVVSALAEHQVEAVLPLPAIVYPAAGSHHKRFVRDQDWDRMMEALKTLRPAYWETATRIFTERVFYFHNIFILRRDWAERYLEWMFLILEEVERKEKGEPERRDRHMGYLGENLTTLFFLHHKQEMKICHAREILLV